MAHRDPFTPYSAGGPRGDPWLFTPDLRFILPAIALGLLALVASWSALGTPEVGWTEETAKTSLVGVFGHTTVLHLESKPDPLDC